MATRKRILRAGGTNANGWKPAPAPFAQHPGNFVRDEVIRAKKMTVTEAASLLGIGRPALSNFLNGKASVSSDMAARIERTFSVPAKTLHDLQAEFDAQQAKIKGVPASAGIYVPPFLGIKADEIVSWSGGVAPRTRFAVLLRTLVNSTAQSLTAVDFPGNDDAESPGWDGYVTASAGTPWVPEGQSGWEFGCNANPVAKANSDYAKRILALPSTEQAETTFIFVTPKRWPGKSKWCDERRAEGRWKDIRVYDASDIEQWIEQSVAGQIWFASETIRPESEGTKSLDACWKAWAGVGDPNLSQELFQPAIDESKRILLSRLSAPPREPTIIAADSIEEALGFLSAALGPSGGDLSAYRDRVVVFDKPGVLPKLAEGASSFIAVVTSRDVERELGPYSKTLHSIALYPRNATTSETHVTLQPLNYEAFRNGLEAMGFDRQRIERLSIESGRSLTVLRRRLATVPSIRAPYWSSDQATAKQLAPFLFAGAWSETNKHDQDVLALLGSEASYSPLEARFQALTQIDDAPLWSVAHYRGVISKLDLLFAISPSITKEELQNFFEIARLVLPEDNPALDLPENERWAASIRGKRRELSAALRMGIGETLVLLAVHGDALFRSHTGLHVSAEAGRVVRELLTPITQRILEAQEDELPVYAEAAPDEFLRIIEADLKTSEPATLSLMRPVDPDLFWGSPTRTGLLWALEALAWNPTYLASVSLILARLSEVPIPDNWSNKPINSLLAIYKAWIPQTAASVEERIKAVELIAKRHPHIAWIIIIAQFGAHHDVGHYSNKPRYRTDGSGFGEVAPPSERIKFQKAMVGMALSWADHDVHTLSDLVDRLYGLELADQNRVWTLVEEWAAASASEADKAEVRERIRITVLSRRGARRSEKLATQKLAARARAAYNALAPKDLLQAHKWLFLQHWVEESADELEEGEFDFEGRNARIADQRVSAMGQVFQAQGLEGLLALAALGKASSVMGWLLANRVFNQEQVIELILAASEWLQDDPNLSRKNIIAGALSGLTSDDQRVAVLLAIKAKVATDEFPKILLLTEFAPFIWRLVDELTTGQQAYYWKEASPVERHRDGVASEGVERLLRAGRPRAAFIYAHYGVEDLPPALLFTLMEAVATSREEPKGHYQLEPYYIQQAFLALDASNEVGLDAMASLEFAFIEALTRAYGARAAHGLPNLERYIAKHPEFFAQVVAWIFKRKDGGEDPVDLALSDDGQRSRRAERGYELLEGLETIPGKDADSNKIDPDKLATWVVRARQAYTALGREVMGDQCLGKLLATSPLGGDGVWPCEPVRDILEQLQSKATADGVKVARFNARGVVWRGVGGAQEREIESEYRRWSKALEFTHPFVATQILKSMADTYFEEATREDAEAGIRRRLGD